MAEPPKETIATLSQTTRRHAKKENMTDNGYRRELFPPSNQQQTRDWVRLLTHPSTKSIHCPAAGSVSLQSQTLPGQRESIKDVQGLSGLSPKPRPLVVAAVVVAGRVGLPGVRLPWRRSKLGRRRATLVRVASVHVGVGSVVTWTRAAAVRLVVSARRRIVIHRAAAGRRVIAATAIIVVVPSRRRWGALTVALAVTTTLSARTISGPRGRSASVVITTWRGIPTTGRPRPRAITARDVWLSLGMVSK